MGRFRYVEDDHEEHDDHADDDHAEDSRHWEFVAEPGSEGSMVPRDTAVSAEASAEASAANADGSREDDHLAGTNQRAAENSLSYAQYSNWLAEHNAHNHDHEESSRSKVRWWFWILLLAVVIQITVLYAPPAPPPMANGDNEDHEQHQDWQSFLHLHTTQLRESVTALCYHTPTHIGRWWMLGLVTDVQQWYDDYQQPPPCPLRVPTGTSDDDAFFLDKLLFGQSDAIEVVTDALQAWEPSETSSSGSQPLLIYLAGMKGVGKTTLARSLAKQLFPKDCAPDALEASILTIDAGYYALADTTKEANYDSSSSSRRYVEETDTSIRTRLAQTIVRHAQRLDGGIVMFQNVDRMAPGLLIWLVRELRGLTGMNTAATGDFADALGAPPSSSIREHCRKVVFVFSSSSAGARTIMKSIRTYGGRSNIPRHGLLLDMLHEIDTHFGAGSSSGDSVGEAFHAVAPLFPLGRPELSQILRHKVDELSQSQARAGVRWHHLTITDAAIEALLDPSQIEYLSWKQQNKNNPIELPTPLLTFSSAGASALQEGTPLMNKFKSKIKVCFLAGAAQPDRVAVVDYDPLRDEVVMQWCSAPSLPSSSALASGALDNEWQLPCDVTCRYKI
jgi:hypothetical protein